MTHSTFDRWVSWSSYTWTFRRFLQHHTELNQMYWSHAVPAAAHSKILRAYSGAWPPATWPVFSTLLKTEIYQEASVYKRAYGDFVNWVRLSAVVALHSYLETFLRSAASLAFDSDHGLLIGAPRAADGLAMLKRRPRWSHSEDARCVSEGAWRDRLANVRRLFGSVPNELKERQDELEALRTMRHNAGHYFGRDLSLRDVFNLDNKQMERVSESRLTTWLDCVHAAALACEKLFAKHIGNFELLRVYHDLRSVEGVTFMNEVVRFRKIVGRELGRSPSKSYVKELIEYYRSA
jgi:hypothetical protein